MFNSVGAFKLLLMPVYSSWAFLWLMGSKWTLAFFFIISGLTSFSSPRPPLSMLLYLFDFLEGTVRCTLKSESLRFMLI